MVLTPARRKALYALAIALQPLVMALGVSLDAETYALVADAILGVLVAFTAGQNVNEA